MVIYIFLSILIILAIVNIIFILRSNNNAGGSDEQVGAMSQQLNNIGESNERMRMSVEQNLERMHKAGQNQFREAREVIGEISQRSERLMDNVNKRLGELDKTNQRIVDFSGQLQDLQDILRNPKQRGVLGEFILEHVLSNVLPPDTFKMQYAFSDGEIVDAVVFAKDKIIPIDSKFSLENYERIINAGENDNITELNKQFRNDLKNRIDETSKYIRPDENTTEFAFMFIPSEAIYYDLLVNRVGDINMIEYAFRDKHVVIVSPTSFLAYLQTVLQGLRALEIEENAKDIKMRVEKLNKHWLTFEVYVNKMGKQLQTTVNHFNKAYGELGKIDKDVMRITERENREIEVEEVDKPNLEIN
ncbi:MAG: DNA recombination protein RmuC [Candidatus Moraniibacteriota bacterium]|jgi:DNA recombination protein RmuC